MGLIRLCACRTRYPLDAVECPTCGISPDGATILDASAPDPAPPPPLRTPETPAVPAGAGLGLLHALAAEANGFILAFAMVELPVNGRVGIGRDPDFCTIAGHLAAFPQTSRRQAEVWVHGDTLSLQHQGTHPTWINGRPCQHEQTYRLRVLDTVEFGPGLYARVRRNGDAA